MFLYVPVTVTQKSQTTADTDALTKLTQSPVKPTSPTQTKTLV